MEEKQWLHQMARDNEEAFTKIYTRYREVLYRTAEHVLQEPQAAQDCVQEVFFDLWRRRATSRIENLRHYLLQSVRFQAGKHIRAKTRYRRFQQESIAIYSEGITGDPVLFRELERNIAGAIASLPADQCRIFRMHREQAVPYKQIAEELGISIKTVEKKISLSLFSLREQAREN